MARPNAPPVSSTSTSMVGFPRESSTWRARISEMTVNDIKTLEVANSNGVAKTQSMIALIQLSGHVRVAAKALVWFFSDSTCDSAGIRLLLLVHSNSFIFSVLPGCDLYDLDLLSGGLAR